MLLSASKTTYPIWVKSDVSSQEHSSWNNQTTNFRIVRVELFPVEHDTEHTPAGKIKTQSKKMKGIYIDVRYFAQIPPNLQIHTYGRDSIDAQKEYDRL